MDPEKPPDASASHIGRPFGSPNRVSAAGRAEAKQIMLRILRDPRYIKTLEDRAFSGTLHPSVETKMWDHAWGVPVKHLEVGPPGSSADLSEMTEEQLAERASMIADVLKAKAAADRAAVQAAEIAAAQQAHDLEREKHAVESVIMKQMRTADREAVH